MKLVFPLNPAHLGVAAINTQMMDGSSCQIWYLCQTSGLPLCHDSGSADVFWTRRMDLWPHNPAAPTNLDVLEPSLQYGDERFDMVLDLLSVGRIYKSLIPGRHA